MTPATNNLLSITTKENLESLPQSSPNPSRIDVAVQTIAYTAENQSDNIGKIPERTFSANVLKTESQSCSEDSASSFNSDILNLALDPVLQSFSKATTLTTPTSTVIESHLNKTTKEIQWEKSKGAFHKATDIFKMLKQFYGELSNSSVNLTSEEVKKLETGTVALNNELLAIVKIAKSQVGEVQNSPKRKFFSKNEVLNFFAHTELDFTNLQNKINHHLEEKIVLNLQEALNSKNNKTKIKNCIGENKASSLFDQLKQHKVGTEEYIKAELQLLHSYRLSLCILADNLIKRADGTHSITSEEEEIYPSLKSNLSEITNLIQNKIKSSKDVLSKETSKNPTANADFVKKETEKFLRETSIGLMSAYIECILDKKIKDVITAACHLFHQKFKRVHLGYKDYQESIYKSLQTMTIQNPIEEWFRAIAAGLIVFLDSEGNLLIEPLKVASNASNETKEALVTDYVRRSTKIISKYLFNFDVDLLHEMSCIMFDLIPSTEFPEYTAAIPGSLQFHARNFSYLSNLKPTPEKPSLDKLLGFLAEVERKMKEKFPDLATRQFNVMDLLGYLETFYRIPTQTYLWSPTGILKNYYKAAFPTADISKDDVVYTSETTTTEIMNGKLTSKQLFQALDQLEDDQTKKIQIKFINGVEFKFFRIGSLLNLSNLMQEMTIRTPVPGSLPLPPQEAVSVQFYYDPSSKLSFIQGKQLAEYLRRISLLLDIGNWNELSKADLQSYKDI